MELRANTDNEPLNKNFQNSKLVKNIFKIEPEPTFSNPYKIENVRAKRNEFNKLINENKPINQNAQVVNYDVAITSETKNPFAVKSGGENSFSNEVFQNIKIKNRQSITNFSGTLSSNLCHNEKIINVDGNLEYPYMKTENSVHHIIPQRFFPSVSAESKSSIGHSWIVNQEEIIAGDIKKHLTLNEEFMSIQKNGTLISNLIDLTIGSIICNDLNQCQIIKIRDLMINQNISIMGIIFTKTDYHQMVYHWDNWIMCISCDTQSGLAILLNLALPLIEQRSINQRLLSIKLQGETSNLCILLAHIPFNKEKESINEYYAEFDKELARFDPRDFIFVLGRLPKIRYLMTINIFSKHKLIVATKRNRVKKILDVILVNHSGISSELEIASPHAMVSAKFNLTIRPTLGGLDGKIPIMLEVVESDNNKEVFIRERYEVKPLCNEFKKCLIYLGTWHAGSQVIHQKLKSTMILIGVSVVGITSTHIPWTGLEVQSDGWMLCHSGAKAKDQGVGFLLKSERAKALLSYKPISSRILSMNLAGTPFDLTLIVVCAPRTDIVDQSLESFYSDLKKAIEEKSKTNIVLVLGNFNNATIGKDTCHPACGKDGFGVLNNLGKYLLDFCSENSLIVANTFFQKIPEKLRTTFDSDNKPRQTDFVLFHLKYRSDIHDANAFNLQDPQANQMLAVKCGCFQLALSKDRCCKKRKVVESMDFVVTKKMKKEN